MYQNFIFFSKTTQIYLVILTKYFKLAPSKAATTVKCCLWIDSLVWMMHFVECISFYLLNTFNYYYLNVPHQSEPDFLQNQYVYFNTLSRFSWLWLGTFTEVIF